MACHFHLLHFWETDTSRAGASCSSSASTCVIIGGDNLRGCMESLGIAPYNLRHEVSMAGARGHGDRKGRIANMPPACWPQSLRVLYYEGVAKPLYSSGGACPRHGACPSHAKTGLEGTPDRQSILVLPGKVTVHQLTCHFISLHSMVLQWVTRKGDRR